MNAQPKLMSPHWQRKSPSELQQQLKDKHAAAAQRRNLQQVQKKARQARAQAGREASYSETCWDCPLLCNVSFAGCICIDAQVYIMSQRPKQQTSQDAEMSDVSGSFVKLTVLCYVSVSSAEAVMPGSSTADANSICHHATRQAICQRFEHCESDEFSMQAVQNVEQERKLASEQQLQQKQARKAQLRDAHLKSIRRKALDETTKVHEVLFINKLQKEDKELTLMQRMQVKTLSACPEPPVQQMHSLVV